MGVVESVKTVSDLYAPVSGTVTKANTELEAQPELVNQEPYGKGWLIELDISDTANWIPCYLQKNMQNSFKKNIDNFSRITYPTDALYTSYPA